MPIVTLVLAAGRGFPSGSADHRYEVELALDPLGRPDAAAWQADPAPWPARRFRPGAPQRSGEVRFDADTGWSLRFPPTGPEEAGELTEPLLNATSLRPGEHVTLRGGDGADFAYRVVSVG